MRIKATKLNILGSVWSLVSKTEEEEKRLKDVAGFTDYSTRELVVADTPDDSYTIGDPHEHMQQTIRHEIIHAFLAESGIWCDSASAEHWSMNEEMVDWMAFQFPKIHSAMIEGNALPGMRLVVE